MSKIEIKLSKAQISLLWQLINAANWNGSQLETAFELKQVFKEVVEKDDEVQRPKSDIQR